MAHFLPNSQETADGGRAGEDSDNPSRTGVSVQGVCAVSSRLGPGEHVLVLEHRVQWAGGQVYGITELYTQLLRQTRSVRSHLQSLFLRFLVTWVILA